jgi:hypothetical protein
MRTWNLTHMEIYPLNRDVQSVGPVEYSVRDDQRCRLFILQVFTRGHLAAWDLVDVKNLGIRLLWKCGILGKPAASCEPWYCLAETIAFWHDIPMRQNRLVAKKDIVFTLNSLNIRGRLLFGESKFLSNSIPTDALSHLVSFRSDCVDTLLASWNYSINMFCILGWRLFS